MNFSGTSVEGCFVVDLDPFKDDRGYFARAWCQDEVADAGLNSFVAQINMSASSTQGTIRGLHWRPITHPEAKFVRCIGGRIFDVCVDVRPDSSTFLSWFGVVLTPFNRRALAIPEGCAHGWQALDPNSEIIYSASARFEPGLEVGARWDDSSFSIDWPIQDNVAVSEKDRGWPPFSALSGGGEG